MIRNLLATTALTALVATGAFAADTKTNAEAEQNNRVFNSETQSQFKANEAGYFQASKGQILASSLIGESLYNGTGENAERIGDVNDVVMGQNGTAEAVVVGVGGFLGIGEKDVAIDFDQLSWIDRDGDRWLVIEASKEELEQAPEFDRTALYPEQPEPNKMAAAEQGGKPQMPEQAGGAPATTGQATDSGSSSQTMASSENSSNGMSTSVEKPNASESMAAAENNAAGSTAAEKPMDSQTAANTDPNKPASARDGLKSVETGALSAEELIGTAVYGQNDESIGEIGDVIVTPEGQVQAFVVDVGGFLGIGEKQVALDATELDIMSDENGNLAVFTGFTQEQLDSQMAFTEDAYKKDPNSVLLR
ncbi:MAG: PRC-barrel domain-containing protein [Flavobacteriaceae bacterium]